MLLDTYLLSSKKGGFMKYIYSLLLLAAFTFSACGQAKLSSKAQTAEDIKVGGGCEDCEIMFEGMPDLTRITNRTRLDPDGELGEKMEIIGKVYHKDGKTPAANVVLYIYHTDHKGQYSPAKDQVHGRRNGQLRGWVKTGEDGAYSFESIRPAAYPVRRFPAHIHIIVKEPGKTPYWIDEVWFDDDDLLTDQMKSRAEKRGGNMLMHLNKDRGVWKGTLNVTLGLNIPEYR